tara:strand:- start:14 stop:775 length:762 start_codon:yes stop_codon:yes gene_type:complete
MTNIKEEEYEKAINITKFNFTCDDLDETIPEPLPRGSFSMLITGKPGSGKTNLLLALLTKKGRAFNRKFDKVFVVSPSLSTIGTDDPFETIPDDQKFSDVSLEVLDGITTGIKDSGDKVLIVLDDCIADLRGRGNAQVENKLQKIFFNRRHLCGAGGSCSIIATSQTYTKIDPKLRKACSVLICFENRNKREIEALHSEMILIPHKEFMDVLKYIYDKKFNFLYLDTTKGEDSMMHKNFNKLIVDSPNIMKYR